MSSRLTLGAVAAIAAVVALAAAAERQSTGPNPQRDPASSVRTGPLRPCKAEVACCPAALKNFVRVGGHPPLPPKLITRVEPDLEKVARPYPCGVVILQLGIDERGEVASSCVERGVRDDFDKAAQAATRRWRYTVSYFQGQPVGMVPSVTVAAPDDSCQGKRGRGSAR